MTEIDFLEIITVVCKRPAMYTKKGSFYEIIAFLEGYAIASNVGENSAHSKFTFFFYWLSAKEGYKLDHFNWELFRNLYETEGEAYSNLVKLYTEYAFQKKN